jgi:hypothetical protein
LTFRIDQRPRTGRSLAITSRDPFLRPSTESSPAACRSSCSYRDIPAMTQAFNETVTWKA